MAKEHTPGPWQVEGRRGAGYIISHGVNAERDGPEGYVGVLDPMFHVAGEPSDLAANARLVTSAPCLLEALRQLKGNAEVARFLVVDPDGVVSSALWDTIQQAEAAIANTTPAKAPVSAQTGGGL